MEDFQIRRAEYKDVSDIMNVINIAVENLPNKNMFYADTKEFISEHIEKRGFSLVATCKEKVAGYIVVRFPGTDDDNLGQYVKEPIDLNKVAHMESTAVLPEFRHNGIQKKLLISAEEKLKDTSYCYYLGTVDPQNEYSKRTLLGRNYMKVDTIIKHEKLTRDVMFKKIEY